MPYREFEAAYAAAQSADPVRFRFLGEDFECMLRPSLGDVFELMAAPEPEPETIAQSAAALARFTRRMLVDQDKQRWDDLLYRAGMDALVPLVDLGIWLAEVYTGAHPSRPPVLPLDGRSPNGRSSNKRTGGRKAS